MGYTTARTVRLQVNASAAGCVDMLAVSPLTLEGLSEYSRSAY